MDAGGAGDGLVEGAGGREVQARWGRGGMPVEAAFLAGHSSRAGEVGWKIRDKRREEKRNRGRRNSMTE